MVSTRKYLLNRIINILTFSLLFIGCGRRGETIQPISYNHAIHVEDEGMECVDCHIGVDSKKRALLPTIEDCESCHSEMNGESSAEAMVVEAVENSSEIAWQRIYMVPDHVYFSHRRHVTVGNVACNACHGNVSELTTPLQNPLIPITMDFCMKCHEEHQITNDCLACHR